MSHIELNIADTSATLIGELTRHTVGQFSKQTFTQLFVPDVMTLDFAQVDKVDTAGLAWLLLLIEQAKKHACRVNFINLPSGLLKLAKLSAVDTFLPID